MLDTKLALEISWSAGLRIDDYLQRGDGDRTARQVVHEVMDGTGLRPLDDATAYLLQRPLTERQQNAAKAQRVLDLVRGGQAQGGGGDFEFVVQNARNIAQTYTFLSVDPGDQGSLTAVERYRDQVMAETTAWWQRRTGGRILLSAHNGHAGYASSDPATYPKTQGSFLSKDRPLGGEWKKFTVGPAAPGTNESTLDRVRYRDYYVDLRKAPAAARSWLGVSRPTCSFGTKYPNDTTPEIAIGGAYDVLVHLHTVREAGRL
ncbi:erythromycin esterase family protein [Streptomyces sp. NPDC089915]|uniref:erythromycin esterase family protein n=1 Tax=Streptomyces sp. NPDC089915 TaxID=3155186 RepID=UPI003444F8B9